MPSSTRRRSKAGRRSSPFSGYESNPWPRAERRLVPRDAFVTGDQKHPHVGNVEQQSVDVESAALRHDDLGRVTWQTERRAERDQLRVPYREERIPMDAARSSEDSIGRNTRQAFIVGIYWSAMLWLGSVGLAQDPLAGDERVRALREAPVSDRRERDPTAWRGGRARPSARRARAARSRSRRT